jgi:DNA adenine methylase
LATQNAGSLTDLERAARFLYLQRTAFGGKVTKQHFGVIYDAPARFDISKLMPMLEEVHERLSGVVIERLHYADFITRYDRAGTLFYLDPPYWGNETDYGEGIFTRDDFTAMAKQLKKLKGRFILSLNDRAEVRDCFKAFNIKSVETTYTVGGNKKAKKVGEVLITGR